MKRNGEELMKKARRIWSHMRFLWNQCISIYIFYIWNYYILYLNHIGYYMSILQKKWRETVKNSWNRTVSAIVTLVTVWLHVTSSGCYWELSTDIPWILKINQIHQNIPHFEYFPKRKPHPKCTAAIIQSHPQMAAKRVG